MKITSLRLAALAFVAGGMSFICPSKASAVEVGIQVGVPPPPIVVEHPWARPYAGAVWIGGHHEWVNGAWVWVGGYYAYPPYAGAIWIGPTYHHGYYHAGHWDHPHHH